MKRSRITLQIQESARKKINQLVYDHKAASVSDVVRTALQEYLKNA